MLFTFVLLKMFSTPIFFVGIIILFEIGETFSTFFLLKDSNYLRCVTNSSFAMAPIFDMNLYGQSTTEFLPKNRSKFYDCNFNDLNAQCNDFWRIQPWDIEDSLKNFEATYILDWRWEDFPRHLSKFIKDEDLDFSKVVLEINKESFSIPFSIRTVNQGHIFLCDGKNPLYSNCYWFLLEGWSGARTALRKCKAGEIPKTSVTPRGDCKKNLRQIEHENFPKLLRGDRWKHFKLVKTDGSLQLLAKDIKDPIIEYADNLIPNLKYIVVQSRNESFAEWKFHSQNYLAVRSATSGELGPLFPVVNDLLCIAMFVKMCPHCILELQIRQRNGVLNYKQTFTSTVNEWKEIKYIIENPSYRNGEYVQLHITADFKGPQTFNEFWYIDRPRFCMKTEFRLLSYYLYDIKANCQLISDEDKIVADVEIAAKPEPNTCPLESRYTTIGPSCFPCDLINGCAYMKYCTLDDKTSRSYCTCSAGSKSQNCQTACDYGSYGHNCEMKCPYCRAYYSCNTINGNCYGHCTHGFSGSRCDIPPGPIFEKSPVVILEDYESCSVRQEDFSLLKATSDTFYYKVQYQKSGENSWNSLSSIHNFYDTNTVKIDMLESDTTYNIRSVIIDSNNQIHNYSSVPFNTCKTTCDLLSENNIVVKPTNISVIINLIVQKHTCRIPNCEIDIFGKRVNKINDETYEFNNLAPFTNYSIHLSNCGYSREWYIMFKTLEGKPDKVSNLWSTVSESSVILKWEPPSDKYGTIQSYKILFWVEKFGGCKGRTERDIHIVTTKTTEYIFDSLAPFATYIFQVAAETSLTGDYKEIIIKTHELGIVTNDELPDVSVTSITAQSIKLQITNISCQNIKGPLYMLVQNQCLDSWCDTVFSQKSYEYVAGSFILQDLKPFTNYHINVTVCRKVTGESCSAPILLQNSTTKPSVPHKVRNLEFYARNRSTLEVRWQAPYPPTGKLKSFLISYNSNKPMDITVDSSDIRCKFWSDYYCWIFESSSNIKVTVSAQNEDIYQEGEPWIIYSSASRTVSSMVYDLSENWTVDNDLIVSWKHPNYTYGDKLDLRLEIEAPKNIKTSEKVTILKQDFNLTYYHKVNHKLDPSKEYSIQISSIQNGKSTAKSQILKTISPPPIPKLEESPQVLLMNGCILFDFKIKPVSFPTDESTVLVVLSNDYFKSTNETISSAPPVIESETKILINQTLRNKFDFNLNITNDIMGYAIYDSEQYGIKLALTNSYKNKVRTKIYYYNVEPATSVQKGNLYLLFLLLFLIIPIILLGILKRDIIIENYNKIKRGFDERQTTFEEPNKSNDNQVLLKDVSNMTKPSQNRSQLMKINVSTENQQEKRKNIKTYSRLVNISDYEQYVRECVENGEFERQHSKFPRGLTQPATYGELKQNKSKNRYNNLVAYDHTRVILEKVDNDEYSDYINANYINGYKVRNAYIATQGPKNNTLYDFWRMIWQENTEYIVMLANIYENGKKKVEKYWPDINATMKLQDITIFYSFNQVFADYEKREFIVTRNGVERKIKQLHFNSWPDHGVPLYSQSLVPFLQEILKISLNQHSPIVLHCSAGVGRTGTILLCDICLRMAAREGAVDVLYHLQKLRSQRPNMVDNVEQYKLAHLVILESLIGMHTAVSCSEIRKNVELLLQQHGVSVQLKYLEDTAWQDQAMRVYEQEDLPAIHHKKNRIQHIIPEIQGRIFLSFYPLNDPQSSYINAVKVDAFRSPGRYIVTQQPLPNTLGDFWRLVDENDISIIISLNEINLDDKSCCSFWPEKKLAEMCPVDYIKLRHVKNVIFSSYELINIEMSLLKTNETKNIDIISLKHWKPQMVLPNSVDDFLMFVEETNALCRRSEKILVTCYDGVTASGIYVAINFVIEKMKLEQICDILQAVRIVRHNRKEFIAHESQYVFLYDAAVKYIEGFQPYANFN